MKQAALERVQIGLGREKKKGVFGVSLFFLFKERNEAALERVQIGLGREKKRGVWR